MCARACVCVCVSVCLCVCVSVCVCVCVYFALRSDIAYIADWVLYVRKTAHHKLKTQRGTMSTQSTFSSLALVWPVWLTWFWKKTYLSGYVLEQDKHEPDKGTQNVGYKTLGVVKSTHPVRNQTQAFWRHYEPRWRILCPVHYFACSFVTLLFDLSFFLFLFPL